MIETFETITYELTEVEQSLVPSIINGMKRHTSANPIKAPEIIRLFNEYKGEEILSEPRLRKIINYVRVNGLAPVIATSKGYFYATSRGEVEAQIRSLHQRASGIASAATGLQKWLDL